MTKEDGARALHRPDAALQRKKKMHSPQNRISPITKEKLMYVGFTVIGIIAVVGMGYSFLSILNSNDERSALIAKFDDIRTAERNEPATAKEILELGVVCSQSQKNQTFSENELQTLSHAEAARITESCAKKIAIQSILTHQSN